MTQTLDVLILFQSPSISECVGILTTARKIAPSLKISILDNTREVTELKADEQHMKFLASPETLTTVANRILVRNVV
jgi:hypothetical protein